ncbi:MAG: calcium/sodium antiporter [Porticoccaceae bacterium]|nr:calcium/sodium antiporter [Porticoccaceae bacterium]
MTALLVPLLYILLGLAGLIWSADRFVIGSAGLARNLGISPLMIGLTIVALGTSAPEVIVSINAVLQDSASIAVGNALGSNLANIGLVLGVTALIAPLPAQRHLIWQEGPVLLLVTLAAGLCLSNGWLGRIESLLLLAMIVPVMFAAIYYKKSHPDPEIVAEGEQVPKLSNTAAILWFVLGLVVMLISARLLVSGAKTVALEFGISELVIGLTVVAIGTSLPELAASLASALKGHHDIAIGNIFGSNMFNLLAVMPIAGIAKPLNIGMDVFYRDYAAVAILTVVFISIIAYGLRGKRQQAVLSRRVGGLLLGLYVLYYLILLPTS